MLTFNDSIQLGVDAGELLIGQFNRYPQFSHFAVDFVDLLLKFTHIGTAFMTQTSGFSFQPKQFGGDFLSPTLAKTFGDRLVELGDGERLRLNFASRPAPGPAIEKVLDLVPARDEEKQAAYPGGDFDGWHGKR
jgi:hypothetical protein